MRRALSGILIAITIIITSITACKKTEQTHIPDVPAVTTNVIVSEVTSTTAISGSLNLSIDQILANGICYSTTNQTPTLNDSKTTDSIAVIMTSKLSGLTPNTTYYIRAYATNIEGTGYGDVITFKTTTTTATRTVTVSTIAGSTTGAYGYANGTGSNVLFNGPQSMSFNANKSLLYISDAYNNMIRTLTAGGVSTSLTQGTIGYTDGPLSSAMFYGAQGTATDAQGNTYVADLGNNVIRKITSAGVVSTFAGNGTAGYVNGSGSVVEFNNPQSVAVDAAGNVYVADRGNNVIRKITAAGVVSTLAGNTLGGWYDTTTPTDAEFNHPTALTLDATGNIYVADNRNKAIRKITPAGAVTTIAGNTVIADAIGVPSAITTDAQGNIFICEQGGRVLEITAAGILYTVAGKLNTPGYANGAGTVARFSNPQGIAVDASGNIYVADYNNNAIRKIVLTVTP